MANFSPLANSLMVAVSSAAGPSANIYLQMAWAISPRFMQTSKWQSTDLKPQHFTK
tara:strand:- start:168 stop:335 length:168 start_codon:yes stop_codon:yes gene_type:complete